MGTPGTPVNVVTLTGGVPRVKDGARDDTSRLAIPMGLIAAGRAWLLEDRPRGAVQANPHQGVDRPPLPVLAQEPVQLSHARAEGGFRNEQWPARDWAAGPRSSPRQARLHQVRESLAVDGLPLEARAGGLHERPHVLR
jgi:hypothetical protein